MQDEEPAEAPMLPAGHRAHDVERDVAANEPAGHSRQGEETPGLALNSPGAQATQEALEVAAELRPYVPAGHRMHCEERLAPTRELKDPRLHGIQLVAPAVSE